MKEILSGLFGGCILVTICIIVSLVLHKQSQIFNPVHIITTNYEIADTTITDLKNFEIKEKLDEIDKLNKKGVLLTPQEYTAHIESFYNNIIALLIALLAVFSIVTYIHLRFLAKEEIQNQVKLFMKSSPEIKEIIEENAAGKIDDAVYDSINEEIVTKRELKIAIQEELQNICNEDESKLGKLKVKKEE